MDAINKVWVWLEKIRLYRATCRYGMARGYLLAGGVAYSALFSIFAGLTIAWTVFMSFIGNNLALRKAVIDGIDRALPGVLDTGNGGIVKPEDLVIKTAFTPASVIAVFILLWSATSVIMSLRLSVQAMFGIAYLPENYLIGKVRDLLGFIVLAFGILLSSLLTSFSSILGGVILGVFGGYGSIIVRYASLLASSMVSWIVLVLIIRFIAGAKPKPKDLWWGTIPGAIILGLIGIAGTSVVGSVTKNPLLAGVAAIVTLLLWVNLSVRVVMYSAAIVSNPPMPIYPSHADELHMHERPNYVTVSSPVTLDWEYEPLTGTLIPDPELNPQTIAQAEQIPQWRGIIGWYKRRKMSKIRARIERLEKQYREHQKQYLARKK